MKKKIIVIVIYIGLILLSTKAYATNGKTINEVTRIRKEATTNSDIVALVGNGTKVEILSEEGEWYKVKYSNYSGFMRKDMLEVEGEEKNTNTPTENVSNETKSEENKNDNTSNENKANIQKGAVGKNLSKIEIKIVPSINSSNITTINENTEFIVKEVINKWVYIESKEKSGWILTKKIEGFFNVENKQSNEVKEEKKEETQKTNENSNSEKKEEVKETKSLNEKKYVSVEILNFRTEPSNTGKVISQLKINTEVTVIEKTNDEWSKINYKDKIGYVSSKYLSDKKVEITSRSETPSRENKKEENKNNNTTNTSTKNQNTTNKESTKNTKTTETKKEENTAKSTTKSETTKLETSSNNSNTSSKGAEVAAYAKQFLGNPYVYGGTSLTNGCDCSGFVMSVYAHFGYSLPHGSNPIARKGVAVSKENLQPGDVVIFTGHCGIYIGGNEFIHAQSSATGIVITSLSSSYYKSRYQGARRIIN